MVLLDDMKVNLSSTSEPTHSRVSSRKRFFWGGGGGGGGEAASSANCGIAATYVSLPFPSLFLGGKLGYLGGSFPPPPHLPHWMKPCRATPTLRVVSEGACCDILSKELKLATHASTHKMQRSQRINDCMRGNIVQGTLCML